jgi:hypothetical protein
MALERELEYYEEKKLEWLEHYKGQFAVVKGRELLATFSSFEEAFEAGVNAVGNHPFLVKQINEGEEIAQFPALMVGVLSVHS